MITVEPRPRSNSAVVVIQNPLKSLNIVLGKILELFGIAQIPAIFIFVILVFPYLELFLILLFHGSLRIFCSSIDNFGFTKLSKHSIQSRLSFIVFRYLIRVFAISRG